MKFQPALRGLLYAVFVLIENFVVLLREINAFTGSFPYADKITEAVLFFLPTLVILGLRAIS